MKDLIEAILIISIYCMFIYSVISIIDIINTLKLYKKQYNDIKIGDTFEINYMENLSKEYKINIKILDKQGSYIYYSYIDAQKGELKFKNHYIFFMWMVNKY